MKTIKTLLSDFLNIIFTRESEWKWIEIIAIFLLLAGMAYIMTIAPK